MVDSVMSFFDCGCLPEKDRSKGNFSEYDHVVCEKTRLADAHCLNFFGVDRVI